MTFQERLITLRKQQGLSQEQLGYELGVTRQTSVLAFQLGSTFTDIIGPTSGEALVALADYFEVSLDYLTGRTNFR